MIVLRVKFKYLLLSQEMLDPRGRASLKQLQDYLQIHHEAITSHPGLDPQTVRS